MAADTAIMVIHYNDFQNQNCHYLTLNPGALNIISSLFKGSVKKIWKPFYQRLTQITHSNSPSTPANVWSWNEYCPNSYMFLILTIVSLKLYYHLHYIAHLK